LVRVNVTGIHTVNRVCYLATEVARNRQEKTRACPLDDLHNRIKARFYPGQLRWSDYQVVFLYFQ